MKIYTKTGDLGETSLFGGTRVKKYNQRIEAYGTIDELNSYIGLIRSEKLNSKDTTALIKIQNELFTIGSTLATPPDKEKLKNGKDRLQIIKVDQNDIEFMEHEIDHMNETLPPMTHFILPGGDTQVSYCHIARCICRKAERICVELHDNEPIQPIIIQYLNRLSDYIFVLARKLSHDKNIEEIKWIPKKT